MPNSNHIEHEIAAERAALNNTINRLSDRLTVDNLADEATQRVAGISDNLVDKFSQTLNYNGSQAQSLTAAVAHAGLDWLLNKRPEPRREYRPQAMYNGPKPAEGDPNLETRAYAGKGHSDPTVSERAAGALETAQQKMMDVRRQAREMRRKIADGTEGLTEEARDRVIAAREKAILAAEATATSGKRVARKSGDFIQENPLVVGGVALALGAAAAGAILWKRHQDDHDSDNRDIVFEAADRVYEEEMDKHETVLAKIND